MLTIKVVCDSPSCSSTGIPEQEDRKGYVGPYAWYSLKVNITGLGPSVHVDACSSDCIPYAIAEVIREAQEKLYG